jgi:thiol-disulfide isomerase/thioredoxin
MKSLIAVIAWGVLVSTSMADEPAATADGGAPAADNPTTPAPRRAGGGRRQLKPGEITTPPDLSERPPEALKVGDVAPDFTLPRADDASETVTLSSYRGQKPVVVVLGSISCPPFRRQMDQVDALYEQYRDRAEFFFVYIREAHPGSTILARTGAEAEEKLQVFPQTSDPDVRSQHAQACQATLKLAMPVLVDGADNAVNRAYAGWPIRIAVIDVDGKLVYYGGPGPRGFQPDELAAWLKEHLPTKAAAE